MINKTPFKLDKILNIQILENVLAEFAKITGLTVTLVDQAGRLVTSPHGKRRFCLLLGETVRRQHCRESDRQGCAKAAEIKAPYIYHCHAGLVDIVIPIIVDEQYMGALLTGQIKLAGRDNRHFEEFLQLPEMAEYRATLKNAYSEVPEITLETVKSASQLLFYIANYIVEIEMKNLKLQANRSRKRAVEQARIFIETHYENNLKLPDLASEVGLSGYYLSHIFKQETGLSFIEYLTQVRIEKAKQLLRNSNLEITEIAFNIGYNNSNYFSHAFKKQVGISPTEFRRKKARIHLDLDNKIEV